MKRLSLAAGIACVAVLACPAHGSAQDTYEFERGNHVRVAPMEADSTWIRGRIFSHDSARLTIQLEPGRLRTLPWDSLTSVQLGVPGSTDAAATRGALVGGIVLGIAVAPFGAALDPAAWALTAGIGALLGSVIGGLAAGGGLEEWVEVPRSVWPDQ